MLFIKIGNVRRSKERNFFLNQGFSNLFISITVKPQQIQLQVLSPLRTQNERAIYPPEFIGIKQLKVSANLQDHPHLDRCSVSCFYKNPYKPYIF